MPDIKLTVYGQDGAQLTETQLTEILQEFGHYETDKRLKKVRTFKAYGDTNKRVGYNRAEFEVDKETLERKIPNLKRILNHENFTIEEKLTSSN